ncbi:diguanylate cyclase [Lysobacter sp. F6437]|uniref:diguanylate cyclase n=1 Tax=Lysobacter sp. F6437 TaxID=3459296 RepID=UPI00403DFBA6
MTESRRQAALDAYAILDTGPEQAFDDIARLAAMICDVPAATISLVDRERQWFKARIGDLPPQTPRRDAICDYTIANDGKLLLVGDTEADARFAGHPLRIDGRPLRFYAGAPMHSPDGHAIGTVCVLDVVPRTLDARQCDSLEVLARQTQNLLELRRYALEQRHLLAEREAFAQQLEAARLDLQRRHDRLEHTATHDSLTGLLNRAGLSQLRASDIDMARLDTAPYVLMLLDIDHFKLVNDRHGHLLGDRALRAVADAVASSVRSGDVAVRYGGEEFLVVLPSARLGDAAEVAERIRRNVAEASRASLPFALTLSAGIAAGDPTRDRPEQVFDRADQALYRAKSGGRDRVVADDTLRFGD